MHGTRRNSGVMGMSERDQSGVTEKPSFFEKIDLVPLVVVILFGIVVIGLLVPDEFKEFSEIIRNWAFVVGGIVGFLLAWRRVLYMEKQTEIALDQIKIATDQAALANKQIDILSRDEKRKDQERIEERLEGAVRLLAEPTDSMKRFAITQLAQIGVEHPEQTLESAVRCLCSHAKEYEPFFPTSLTETMRSEAVRAGTARFREMREYPLYEFSVVEDQIEEFFQQARQLQVEQRSVEIIKASMEAINDLERKAIHVREAGMDTENNAQLAVSAPIDLQGVTITGVTVYSLGIYTDRFQGCVFKEVDFEECNFKGTFNRMSKFLRCRFSNCTFEGASFFGSEFTESIFSDAEMSRSSNLLFSSCDMSSTYFDFNEANPYSVRIDETHPDRRLSFIGDDFRGCYIKAQSSEPEGLDENSPPLRVVKSAPRGERASISIVLEETNQNSE